jgi:hypothetical protein
MTVAQAVQTPASPWNAKQRLMLAVLLALGVAGLIAGYIGTSGTLRVSKQVVWINLAGAALLVSGAGVVLFLTAARREIGRRRLSLFGDLGIVDGAPVDRGMDISAADLVTAPTMTKYHRADCSFVDGKTGLKVASSVDHQKVGKQPCGVCLPGGDS